MNKTIFFLILMFLNLKTLNSTPLEIDVTKGKIEPLPIAITNFNYTSSIEKVISKKISLL